LRRTIEERFVWPNIKVELFVLNGQYMVTIAGYVNRPTVDAAAINDLVNLVEVKLPGSWGLLHERDADIVEGSGFNSYRVTKIARGHVDPGEHDCVTAGCEWWLSIRVSRAESSAGEYDKDTKTHQMRRVALDMATVAILTDFRRGCDTLAKSADMSLVEDAYMFAASIDGSVPLKPRTVTQRYKRLVTKLGITTSIKMLRHYSATELLTGGVDVRT